MIDYAELINLGSDRLDFDIQAEIAKQAYQYAALDERANESAADTAARNAQTWVQAVLGSQGNALKALELITQNRGAKNAFIAEAVRNGLNSAGLSKAVDAIAGRTNLATSQAPQAPYQPNDIQGAIASLGLDKIFSPDMLNQAISRSAAAPRPMPSFSYAPRVVPPPVAAIPNNATIGGARAALAGTRISPPAPGNLYTPGLGGDLRYAPGASTAGTTQVRMPDGSIMEASNAPVPGDPYGRTFAEMLQQSADAEAASPRPNTSGNSYVLGDDGQYHRAPGWDESQQYVQPGSDVWQQWANSDAAWGNYQPGATLDMTQQNDGSFAMPDQGPTANYGDIEGGQMYVGADPNGYGDPNNWVDVATGDTGDGAANGGLINRPRLVGENGPEIAEPTPYGTAIIPLTRPATGLVRDIRQMRMGAYRPRMAYADGGLLPDEQQLTATLGDHPRNDTNVARARQIMTLPAYDPAPQAIFLGTVRKTWANSGDGALMDAANGGDADLLGYVAANDQGTWGQQARQYQSAANPWAAYTPGATFNGDPNTDPQAYAKALPDLNKIVSRNWIKLAPETQQFLLGSYLDTKGIENSDVLNAVARNLPGRYAYRPGYALTRR